MINEQAQNLINEFQDIVSKNYVNKDEIKKGFDMYFDLIKLPKKPVEFYENRDGWNAARNATWNTSRNIAWDTAWNAAWYAARDTAWDTTWNTSRNIAWGTAWNAALDTARNAAWYAARDTAWNIAWAFCFSASVS